MEHGAAGGSHAEECRGHGTGKTEADGVVRWAEASAVPGVKVDVKHSHKQSQDRSSQGCKLKAWGWRTM